MTVREGSLEAPTRHPIDWKSPDFYDPEKLAHEMERVFDICHGCRRCVSLCGSFPALFDLVDNSSTGEVDGVAKSDYHKVVEQCYLCDLCYMTKCPYVPPHAWNVDFPHLMLRAKAVAYKRGEVRLRDRVLDDTDALGQFAGIPIVTQIGNVVNGTSLGRAVMQQALGIDAKAWMPPLATKRFPAAAPESKAYPVRDGERTPGKVAIFYTCYANYNEPGIALDLLRILDHNEIPYVLVDQVCCGMPHMESGALDEVARQKEHNLPRMAELARAGYAILTPIPSCTLQFKQEIPLMFRDDPDVQLVKQAMYDPFEYFVARNKDGLLKTDFSKPLGRVSYHVPCHLRVQNMGRKTEEFLKLIPGTTVTTVERCSGHSGAWGMKEQFHQMAMKIGKPVFKAMAEAKPDFISSDCQLGGRHIEQGTHESNLTNAPLAHPLTLVRMAYGL
ncbi:MAG: heterodisulfide reductase-related iron-sulfur binding cluster [Burkholderiales bacterium]|nr:heterodisulfide reductase-related iron-sulfur binding cluster [Burkholderiales bacterium]